MKNRRKQQHRPAQQKQRTSLPDVREEDAPAAARAAKRCRTLAQHTEVGSTEIAPLEQSAVAQKQQELYLQMYQGFKLCALAARLPIRTITALEVALLFWLLETFFKGELTHQAQRLVAALAA